MSNSATDNNAPTTFQPMPKRFMVWHRRGKGWLKGNSGEFVLNLVDISKELRNNPNLLADCIIMQSTNLFDKDGKEIFEGNIVEDEYNETLGYIYYESAVGGWRIKFVDGEEDDGWTVINSESVLKIVGHILSNPELMEEKDV